MSAIRDVSKIVDYVGRRGGEATFRDLKKSHCFTESEIREFLSQNLKTLEIFWWQNPAGGPRSERVRLKRSISDVESLRGNG